MNNTNYALSEKLAALRSLLLEIAMLIFIVFMVVLILGVLSNLIAHFIFGYSCVWEMTHFGDSLLFLVIIATPALLMGGLVWSVLRDEYLRILERRKRKW
ncbi:hypothetical protein HAP94_25920 [Acidithiobacillus ferrivorans]|nr:hypothetical protein [Acidithiobacillus ferrivorans]